MKNKPKRLFNLREFDSRGHFYTTCILISPRRSVLCEDLGKYSKFKANKYGIVDPLLGPSLFKMTLLKYA